MKNWENIVKEKLEGYESELPEGSLAGFHARRQVAGNSSRVAVWIMTAAVAAGLSALLLLRRGGAPEDTIQTIRRPAQPVAFVADSACVTGPAQTVSLIAHAVRPNRAAHNAHDTKKPEIVADVESAEKNVPMSPEDKRPLAEKKDTNAVIASPFIPGDARSRPVEMRIAPLAGAVAGSGLLVAALTPLSTPRGFDVPVPNELDGGINAGPDSPRDELTGRRDSHFPFKVGLSAGIPVSGNLRITAGLEYGQYSSTLTYAISGEKKLFEHYLSVPVRLDWMLAFNERLELYSGGGIGTDFLVRATLGGDRIPWKGFRVSLLGAVGVQFNVTERVGLYLEPGLHWTVYDKSQNNRGNRLTMPVATGLRINL